MTNVVPFGAEPKTPTQLLLSLTQDVAGLEEIADVLIVTIDKNGVLQASNNAMSAERMIYLATVLYLYATR